MSSDGPELSDLLGMGASIAGCLIIGFGLGSLVDHLLGIVAACFYTYGQFKKYM